MGARRRFAHLNFEVHGQIARRVAGTVVAGLVAELSADVVLAGSKVAEGVDDDVKGKVAAIDVELLIGSERESQVTSGGIANRADDDIGGRVQFEDGGNQVGRVGAVGVDVEALLDAKVKLHRVGFAAGDRGDAGGSHLDGRARSLGESSGGEEQNEKQFGHRVSTQQSAFSRAAGVRETTPRG